MTGQSQEASLKPLMMTHQLRREAARTIFFSTKFPHDTYLKMIRASLGIILSHICCGTSGPPALPTSPVSPLGVPVPGAPKGGGPGKGLNPPPPPPAPAHKPVFPQPRGCSRTGRPQLLPGLPPEKTPKHLQRVRHFQCPGQVVQVLAMANNFDKMSSWSWSFAFCLLDQTCH